MRYHRVSLVATVIAFLAPLSATAAEYYVSPTGSDSNAGTFAEPFASLSKASNTVAAGDTVWLRGGTYALTTQITLKTSGTSDTNRTKFWAYPGELPVFDCSGYVTSNAAVDVPVILVTGNFMHLKGFEVANAKVGNNGDHSYSMVRTKGASNNTFELLNIHHGFGPGLFIDTGTGGNLILNCDSHDNYDLNGSQGDGQNGDGFGVHYQKSGPSTIVRGCRAWHDSDDGYDLIYQEVPVIVENSYAFSCGYGTGGNGNGFKMGSSITGIRHIVQRNVAWSNKAAGFYANHSTGGNTWYNNTSYHNGTQYNMLASSFAADGTTVTGTIILSGSLAHIMRNNVGFPNSNSNMGGVDTAFNTWELGIAETASDFASTDGTPCTGPRQADGSIPAACTFMLLKAGSPLIDKGTNVSLPFVGVAPDLGADEFGALPATGGATGTGGATSNGGAATGGTAIGGSAAAGGSATAGGKATGGSAIAGGAGGAVVTMGGNSATGGSTTTAGAAAGGKANGGGTTAGGALAASGSDAVATAGGAAKAGGNGGKNTVGNGGALAIGGNSPVGGATTGGSVIGAPEAGGCSCSVPTGTHSRYRFALFGLGLLGLMRRRRGC